MQLGQGAVVTVLDDTIQVWRVGSDKWRVELIRPLCERSGRL